ncbi:hypothetical protein Pmani_032334 [Petrolisthes manimaculis]|uniref:BZIP domain-containing protein n=1 Tax=Petrolisthes manimaculis TaxID=1843537 RepID=A0AAE1TTW5_9EUCA|nr:hypothetical protein Pmani_032334 [Petrolisthes manimaculis]
MAEFWTNLITFDMAGQYLESDMDSLINEYDDNPNPPNSLTQAFTIDENNSNNNNQIQQELLNLMRQQQQQQHSEQQECYLQSQLASSQIPQQQQQASMAPRNFVPPTSPQYEKVGGAAATCTRGSIAYNFVQPDISSQLSEVNPATSSSWLGERVGNVYNPQIRTSEPGVNGGGGGSRAFNFVGDKSVADVQGIHDNNDVRDWVFFPDLGNGDHYLQNVGPDLLEVRAANAADVLLHFTAPMGNSQSQLTTTTYLSQADGRNYLPQIDMEFDLPQTAMGNDMAHTSISKEVVQNMLPNHQPQISTFDDATLPQASASDTPTQTSTPDDVEQVSLPTEGATKMSVDLSHNHPNTTNQNHDNINNSKSRYNNNHPNKRDKEQNEETDTEEAASNKKMKLYEQPPSDNPKQERRRRDAIRAKRIRDEFKNNHKKLNEKLDRVEAENKQLHTENKQLHTDNKQLHTQNFCLLQLLHDHNITIPSSFGVADLHEAANPILPESSVCSVTQRCHPSHCITSPLEDCDECMKIEGFSDSS